MRYNQEMFNEAVSYYKNSFEGKNVKNVFLYGNITEKSFFSIAPLSYALDNLKIDLHVNFGESFEILFDVWKAYLEKDEVLVSFIKNIEGKISNFGSFFEKPDVVIKAGEDCFSGDIKLEFKYKWFNDYRKDDLRKATDLIIKECYALKNEETFSIGIALLPEKLKNPLQDYLDSYAISFNMYLSAVDICRNVLVKGSTQRLSMRDEPESVSELLTTLLGLELEKDIDEEVFKKYRIVSEKFNISRLKIPEASFFVSTKGYHGKHSFGEVFGYPTKNKKTKWSSPGSMIYKFHWYPQSEDEERPPKSRLNFTQTVPIDNFIESTLIDYNVMRSRNKEIGDALAKCDKIVVKSNIENGCDFAVGLLKKNGERRRILYSDSDTRYVINPRILEETGKEMGMMANIPGGEAFTTPVSLKGKIVGDCVIQIDKSYRLNSDNPFVAESDGVTYNVVSGPKEVVDAFNEKKNDAWNNLIEQEKAGLDPKLVELKKNNFEKIGEFAINTNPNAKLCDYLIINEKIANMIHVAFGSGFEPETATEYHMDVVIDSPRQKLDIYGIDENNNEHWILKEGKFVI